MFTKHLTPEKALEKQFSFFFDNPLQKEADKRVREATKQLQSERFVYKMLKVKRS